MDKIKRNTLIAPISMGGLRAPHIRSFIQSLKCTWAHRYTNSVDTNWKVFFDYFLSNYGKDCVFRSNFRKDDIKVGNLSIQDV